MGLGKTRADPGHDLPRQAGRRRRAPFLIVAPTSVVANWAAEAARFAPGLTVVDDHRHAAPPRPGRWPRPSPAPTSWSPPTPCSGSISTRYAAADWSGLILDEAQFVKNHQSKVYQCARRLPAPFKLAITGTPMENNLMELWSLLSITAPGSVPASRPGSASTTPDRSRISADAELLARLRRRIKPLVRSADQGAGGRRPPGEAGQLLEVELDTRHRAHLPAAPAAGAAEGPRPARRRGPQPVHHPALADAAAAAAACTRA